MGANTGPDPDNFLVKAVYALPDTTEKKLQRFQNLLGDRLYPQGYVRTSGVGIYPSEVAPRTIEYHYDISPDTKKPLSLRIKDIFGLNIDDEMKARFQDNYLRELRRIADHIPFQISLYFWKVSEEDFDGFHFEIETTPALLQKYRQLELSADYTFNSKDIVKENKRWIENQMRSFGLLPLSGPYVEAERVEQSISGNQRTSLGSTDFGRSILTYLDEGDGCLERSYLHASLSCYIHAIEWAIITYWMREKGEDLISQQVEDGSPIYYRQLTSKLKDGTPAKQRTIEALQKYNEVERRWIAHHREGELRRTRVESVRETLLVLIDELFPNTS